ncbi:MAG TPA: ABC transporter substrate-binding protein [Lachnospiraceae bacterium]|nr:ABC transporter substrate-binding protein [Lachnospiraceae bacterium]
MMKKFLSIAMSTAMVASMLSGAAVADETESGEFDPGTGKVYYLNFKPEVDQQWQDLAAAYTDEYGIEVNVLTAASGEYETTLQSEMAKSNAPTIFNVGNSAGAKTWDDYTYDLTGTWLDEHSANKNFNVHYGDKLSSVAFCYESFGIIYNKTILEGYCEMEDAVVSSIDEIDNFDTLLAVATDINERVDEINDELGTDLTEAFVGSGLDSGNSWRYSGHLANMPLYYEFLEDGVDPITDGEATIDGTYLDNFRKVWDMYVDTSAADKATLDSGTLSAADEFGLGEAVFYQNGDWEFSTLMNEDNGYDLTEDDLGMMPIYFGVDDENEGLCSGTENCWAINSQASEEDIESSLAFLQWVVSSDEGRRVTNEDMGLTMNFDTYTGDYAAINPFGAAAQEMAAEGKTAVEWAFNATPNVDTWRQGLVDALITYTANGQTDEDWDGVVSAFVDGWNEQWELAHEE